jgi:hypothetical protein
MADEIIEVTSTQDQGWENSPRSCWKSKQHEKANSIGESVKNKIVLTSGELAVKTNLVIMNKTGNTNDYLWRRYFKCIHSGGGILNVSTLEAVF